MPVTIDRVETIALRLPYDHWAPKPTFGGIARDTMDCLLVRVTASNGLVGWGEAFWGGWQATQAAVEQWVAPLARGQDVNDRQMFARFERALHNFGRSGPFIYALAGLDIALWDLRGKLEGVPVHALLGGKKRDKVEVYASLIAYQNNLDHVMEVGWEEKHWNDHYHEVTLSTPIFDENRIYIRGEQFLYCIGDK